MTENHDNCHDDDDQLEISLDDLGAAYARAAAEHDGEAFAVSQDVDETLDHAQQLIGGMPEPDDVVTPESIIEAALFVGHPNNQSFSQQRLASLMRDVSPDEVQQIIDHLNESYKHHNQALRIVRDEHGYRMSIAPQVEMVRRSFLGKVREARLSQMAIEVLSLVAYQPGITAQKVQDQRGQESGALLNQLVRRQLLRIERVTPEQAGRSVAHYYPTERFLVLFGLESIEDLPHVEEQLREG